MSDQSKRWQEIASQGIATERTLRIRIAALEAALREIAGVTTWTHADVAAVSMQAIARAALALETEK